MTDRVSEKESDIFPMNEIARSPLSLRTLLIAIE